MKTTSAIKNTLYAVLLGVGMAACLSQNDGPTTGKDAAPATQEIPVSEAAAPSPANFVIQKG